MANIPGVPGLDPVNKPLMNPAQAGRPGEVISQLGEVSNDATLQQQSLDLYMKKAQMVVDETAFQNQAHASILKYQEALAKTTNSRDVADVTKQAQDDMTSLTQQWGKSPAAVRIQMQADGLLPQIQHLGVVKTADLQVKESAVQTDLQMQTLLPQLVTAQRNGDTAQVNYINAYIDHIQSEREKAGLVSHAEVEKENNAIQIQFRQQLNEAAIASANPKERLSAIEQLKTGGSGPLNLAGLAPGDIAALRTHAEATNEHLNNLSESADINHNLNIVQNAFQAPEYKNNYEARINSLEDGDWLKQHGIVNQDGEPDRIMAQKLVLEQTRERAEWQKERADNDDKIAEKLSPLIDEHQMSQGQLNMLLTENGASPKVRAQLTRQWRANTNEAIRLSNESYEVAQRIKAQKSQESAADWVMRIGQGQIPSDADIRSTPNMSKADKADIMRYRDKAKEDKPYQGGMTIITAAFPQTGKMPIEEQANHHRELLMMQQAYDQAINENPSADKSEIAMKLVAPGLVRDAIVRTVEGRTTQAPKPSLWTRMINSAHSQVNAIEGVPDKTEQPAGDIRVRDKATGKTGRVPASEFDPKLYEKVE